jgi:phage anti-repressor protein
VRTEIIMVENTEKTKEAPKKFVKGRGKFTKRRGK